MQLTRACLAYLIEFIFSPRFREKQKWYDRIIFKLSAVHNHIWTASRIIVIPLLIFFLLKLCIGWFMAIFLPASLTDCVDGAVARKRKKSGIKPCAFYGWLDRKIVDGNFFDGVADKIMISSVLIASLIIFWSQFSKGIITGILCLLFVDSTGNILIGSLNKYFFKVKDRSELYAHNYAGKFKFGSQVVLITNICYWVSRCEGSGWPWWEYAILINLIISIVSACMSVWNKITSLYQNWLSENGK